jgi:F0F1-type ATP synthase delta subunit
MNHVVVTTALPLDDAQRAAVAKVITGKKVGEYELREVVDARILGGIKLAINGQSYDATVQGKLQALQAGLAKEMV